MVFTGIFTSTILADLHLRFCVHVRFVALQLSWQGKASSADVARVWPLRRSGESHRRRRLHDHLLRLLLQVTRRCVVDTLVVVQQTHVSEHEATNVTLEGRVRGEIHLIDEGVVADRLNIEAIATLIVGRNSANRAHRIGLNFLQHVDIVIEGKFGCCRLLARLVLFLVARHVHLLGLLLLRLLTLCSLLLLNLLWVEHCGLLGLMVDEEDIK